MEPGEFVVADMGSIKTRAVSLGRSRLAHDPVVHIVLIWIRLVPDFVENVQRLGAEPGCSTPLQDYRHYGDDIAP